MVNEINGPPAGAREDEALRVRMETSNRNILSMQQEHQELLQEMERLRQRAAQLSRPGTAGEGNSEAGASSPAAPPHIDGDNAPAPAAETTPEQKEAPTENPTPASAPAQGSSNPPSESHNKSEAAALEEDFEEDDPETAEYIRQKIAEIAAMKAQFKRVENLVHNTNLIEEHIARSTVETNTEHVQPVQPIATATAPAPAEPQDCESRTSSMVEGLEGSNIRSNSTEENEELLRTMLSMFNEFTSDLREQATTLRAERDRLKALRDEILRRRHQS